MPNGHPTAASPCPFPEYLLAPTVFCIIWFVEIGAGVFGWLDIDVPLLARHLLDHQSTGSSNQLILQIRVLYFNLGRAEDNIGLEAPNIDKKWDAFSFFFFFSQCPMISNHKSDNSCSVRQSRYCPLKTPLYYFGWSIRRENIQLLHAKLKTLFFGAQYLDEKPMATGSLSWLYYGSFPPQFV